MWGGRGGRRGREVRGAGREKEGGVGEKEGREREREREKEKEEVGEEELRQEGSSAAC